MLEFQYGWFGVVSVLQATQRYSKPTAPNLQHTMNREQNDRCGNSSAQSQAPDDGYINIRIMLITLEVKPNSK